MSYAHDELRTAERPGRAGAAEETVRAEPAAPKLSIIIVSYNTREMTLECLRSAFRETRATTFEIILVDNQSRDGSADAVEAEFGERVRLIRSERNLGFAAANNLAAQRALGEMILLLNPDTVVRGGAIDAAVSFATEQPRAGIWGGRTLFADGSLNPTSCWRRMSMWTLFCSLCGLTQLFPRSELLNPECYGRWARDSVRRVDIVTGCFLLIPRELWERLGGFDPAFFMYGEEADLCLRARRLGARPMINPRAEIVHYGSASDTVHAEKAVAIFRGRVSLARRHFPRVTRKIGIAMLVLSPAVKAAAYSCAAGLSRKPRHKQKAVFWREVWGRRREWLAGYDA